MTWPSNGAPPLDDAQQPIFIVLPIIPVSANRMWRVQSGGHGHLSPKYAAWLASMGLIVRSQARGRKWIGPYAFDLAVARPDKRRRDLDNLLKAASDLIVKCGLVEDDCKCEDIRARWVKQESPCRITISAPS